MAKNFNAWPKDWPRSIDYPKLPVYYILDQAALRVPNRRAIVFGGMELTFLELKTLTERFASALSDLGVQKGDRVAIHLLNMPQFVIAYYGLLRLGAVFTPLNPLLSQREARHQLNDSGATVVISLDLMFPVIQPILKETPIKTIITTSIADCYNALIQTLKPINKIPIPDTLDMAELLKQHDPWDGEVDIDVENDLAHLAYTGGTTGVSKGVMLTHYNVVVNTIQTGNWFSGGRHTLVDGVVQLVFPPGIDPVKDRPLGPDRETSLIVAPWFHAMGVVGFLNTQINAGNTMIVYPRFDPAEYIGGVAKYNATILGGAPQLYIPIVNLPEFADLDLSGIKAATSGAAPLPMNVLEKLLDAFSGLVCEAYGLTECTMMATMNPPYRDNIRPGSVGIPAFDTEVKAVDPVTGQDLPVGSEGEIAIKGPQVMKGYWNHPEATAEVLKNGWLLTGDIGREDEDGFFYITDRKKDLILYKGYNVYPRELEEVLFEHPAVQQCAVVGKPDELTGEYPVAFVELRKDIPATDQDIMDHVNSQVAPYKKIREIRFIDAIPVSAAGKVLRRELRSQL